MFDELRKSIEERNVSEEVASLMESMSEGGAIEDDILDDIVISSEEEKKIENLVDKIPDDDFETDSDGEITDKVLERELKKTVDTTMKELLDD